MDEQYIEKIINDFQASVNKIIEMQDMRKSRTEICVALIAKGMDPKEAATLSKDVVIILYAAAAN